MSKDKENRPLLNASSVLQKLLTNGGGLSDQFQRWRLWVHWSEVVGEELAKFTCPVGFQRGALLVWVNHPGQMHDLYYIREPMIEKINAHLGKRWVRYLKFTTDRKSVPKLEETGADVRGFLSKEFPNEDGEPQLDR